MISTLARKRLDAGSAERRSPADDEGIDMTKRISRTAMAGLATAAVLGGGALTATPAGAAPGYQPNPAGFGITTMQGECGGQPTTVVTNGNHSSENGGWSAARVYGEHTVYIPRSFAFTLLDATNGLVIVSGTQTKNAGPTGSITCSFSEAAVDDQGNPLTFQDLIDAGQATAEQLPLCTAGQDPATCVSLTDQPGNVFSVTVDVRSAG